MPVHFRIQVIIALVNGYINIVLTDVHVQAASAMLEGQEG